MNTHCAELSSCTTTFIQYFKRGQINLSLISKHDEMNTINIVINSCDIKFSRDSFRISSIFFQWNQLFYTTIVTIRSLRRSELTYWTLANRLQTRRNDRNSLLVMKTVICYAKIKSTSTVEWSLTFQAEFLTFKPQDRG